MTDHAKVIKDHMSVVCSDGTGLGAVDHLEGENSIKLTRDEHGNHHWIPISWVKSVNGGVRLDRSIQHAKDEWSDSNPAEL